MAEYKVNSRAVAQRLRGILADHDSSTHWLGAANMFWYLQVAQEHLWIRLEVKQYVLDIYQTENQVPHILSPLWLRNNMYSHSAPKAAEFENWAQTWGS